jgi:hypothetical protein
MFFLSLFPSKMRPGKASIMLTLGFLCLCLALSSRAAAQEASPSQVKAAFLFNFAKFVQWPPEAFANNQGSIYLCILKGEPLAKELVALQGKEVQGRKIIVKQGLSIEEMKKCQIFFGSASEIQHLHKIMEVLACCPVLTVTDEVDDFARYGGIINLVRLQDKIGFAISLKNAEKRHLKISSQLLKLAIRVSN